MRPVSLFFAIAMAIGFFILIGRFLFAIWFAGAILVSILFAARGIRRLIARRRYEFDSYREAPLRVWRNPRALPVEPAYLEPLAPMREPRLEILPGERIIPVQ